jgi:hypothetical protein
MLRVVFDENCTEELNSNIKCLLSSLRTTLMGCIAKNNRIIWSALKSPAHISIGISKEVYFHMLIIPTIISSSVLHIFLFEITP